MQLAILLQILVAASAVQASAWKTKKDVEFAAAGCKFGISKVADFCGTKEGSKVYKCACKNKNAITSWLNCGYEYFPDIPKEDFDAQVVKLCKKTSGIKKSNLTAIWEANSPKLVDIGTLDSFNKTSPKFPIRGKKVKKAILGGYYGERNRWRIIDVSHYLGIAFLAGVGLIMIIAGMINWLARLSRSYANSGNNALQKNVRKHLTLGIFPRHLQASSFGGGINPDRLEALLITVMVIYSILANFILGYSYYEGDLTFATKAAGYSRYFGDRSCIVLSYQLPLLFLFPGRNNFFQYITRWRQSRFLTLHKWISRIIIAEVFIHTVAMANQTYVLHKSTRFATAWYRYGIVGTIFFFLIPVFALPVVRKRWYEVFVFTHVLFVVSAIWTSFLHAKSQAYQQFYWAAIGIWIFDRLMRFVRIAFTGGVQKVEIEYFEVSNAIKFSIKNDSFLKAHAGSHAFIHFLSPKYFFQSHPFTCYPSESKPGCISFTGRVKKGITKVIADQCKANGGKISMNIAVDGFYAEESHYHFFDKSVFICGGTGFAAPYFYAKNLVETLPNHEVKFYFSVRHIEELKEYMAELLSFKNSGVKPVIYLTQADQSISGSGSSDNENKESVNELVADDEFNKELENFEIINGRIPVVEIIDREILESTGSVAFGVCAHPEIVDIARHEIANSLNKSSKKIEYFEEMQLW